MFYVFPQFAHIVCQTVGILQVDQNGIYGMVLCMYLQSRVKHGSYSVFYRGTVGSL